MRSLLAVAVLVLTSPVAVSAADLTVGTCAATVGAWDFVGGGRTVIARDGEKYHSLWLTTFVNAKGETEREGVGAECSCQDAKSTLVWKCRVAYSFDASQVGSEVNLEWKVDGGVLNTWYIAPDGTRSATGLRRVR